MPRSEYMELIADAGSGVPAGCRWPLTNDTAECGADDDAEVGPLPLPSSSPKLPDLECALDSSSPPEELPVWYCEGARLLGGPMS